MESKSKMVMLEEIYKVYKNNPPHLFKPNSKYMVTGSTYLKEKHLAEPTSKERLLLSILKACQRFDWKLEDWVILDNHYHLMLESPEKANSLPQLINEVHKFTSIWIRKNTTPNALKKIFYNYWDSCITYKRSYFIRLNYIYFNPVKHGYVTHPKDYPFGSYFCRYLVFSRELERLEHKYPFERINVMDNF